MKGDSQKRWENYIKQNVKIIKKSCLKLRNQQPFTILKKNAWDVENIY